MSREACHPISPSLHPRSPHQTSSPFRDIRHLALWPIWVMLRVYRQWISLTKDTHV